MDRRITEQYILNSIFLLSNKLQLAGDNLCSDITLKQFLLLNIIKNWQEGIPNMNDLAALMGCTRQNIKNIITPLKNKGYIKVKENGSDKRARAIFLSKKGLEYFKINKSQTDLILKGIFENIDSKDLDIFFRVLNNVFDNVNFMVTNNI